jgi:hypothetical protein
VIGGGALGEGPVGGTEDGVALRASYPANRRTWRVIGVDANQNEPQRLRSFVTCAKDSKRDQVRKVRIRDGESTLAPGTGPTELFASCESGERPIGGGLETDQGSGALFMSAPDPDHSRRWLTRSRLNGNGTPRVLCVG